MRQHILPEVQGTAITVTKKATVIKLDQQPPIENNNEQDLFIKAPGFLITQQHTPGQFNFSYRGLGNPQESEFTLVLRDGLPLMSDWIGFPTLYYLPLPQSIREIQFIRGGSSLLYGPEPAPVVNFITKYPAPGSPWNFYTEQIGGGYGYYSTYNVIQEAMGPLEFRLDAGYVRADGQRDNSQYKLWQTDLYLGYRPDEHQLFALDFYSSRFDGGDPGRITYKQWVNDPNFRLLHLTMTGLIDIRLFCDTRVTLDQAGLYRSKVGSPIRRSMRALRRTTFRERPIHFLQAPHSVTRHSTMAGLTYVSASCGETTPSLKAALSRLAALFIMVMRRL
jgi:hypothetical protein